MDSTYKFLISNLFVWNIIHLLKISMLFNTFIHARYLTMDGNGKILSNYRNEHVFACFSAI